jgi:hypothetical protein
MSTAITHPATLVEAVYFTVPTHYTIGERFGTWQEAVDHARSTIAQSRYPGQRAGLGAHPRRYHQDGSTLVVDTRAFVDLRVTEPIQDREDSSVRSGSDHSVMTWEVFADGTVEVLR